MALSLLNLRQTATIATAAPAPAPSSGGLFGFIKRAATATANAGTSIATYNASAITGALDADAQHAMDLVAKGRATLEQMTGGQRKFLEIGGKGASPVYSVHIPEERAYVTIYSSGASVRARDYRSSSNPITRLGNDVVNLGTKLDPTTDEGLKNLAITGAIVATPFVLGPALAGGAAVTAGAGSGATLATSAGGLEAIDAAAMAASGSTATAFGGAAAAGGTATLASSGAATLGGLTTSQLAAGAGTALTLARAAGGGSSSQTSAGGLEEIDRAAAAASSAATTRNLALAGAAGLLLLVVLLAARR